VRVIVQVLFSRETLSFEGKQNYFLREQAFYFVFGCDEIKILKNTHTTIVFCDKKNIQI
jgi:hypothetical protein